MDSGTLALILGVGLGGWWAVKAAQTRSEEDKKVGPRLRCPHCAKVGQVEMRRVVRKKGLSGGKATAGLMTGGVSLFAVGLSRKQGARHMVCHHCGMEWDVE